MKSNFSIMGSTSQASRSRGRELGVAPHFFVCIANMPPHFFARQVVFKPQLKGKSLGLLLLLALAKYDIKAVEISFKFHQTQILTWFSKFFNFTTVSLKIGGLSSC